MSQNHASFRWTTPKYYKNLGKGIYLIQNPKSKIGMASARLELAASGLEDLRSESIELQSRKFKGKMEGTRGFEPPTCSFVASRADSVAPRPRMKIKISIYRNG